MIKFLWHRRCHLLLVLCLILVCSGFYDFCERGFIDLDREAKSKCYKYIFYSQENMKCFIVYSKIRRGQGHSRAGIQNIKWILQTYQNIWLVATKNQYLLSNIWNLIKKILENMFQKQMEFIKWFYYYYFFIIFFL